MEERERHGSYASAGDFVSRTGLKPQSVLSLVMVGAFDGIAPNRREALWEAGLHPRPSRSGQTALSTSMEDAVPKLDDLTEHEKMAAEYRVLGVYPRGHLMEFVRPSLRPSVLPAAESRNSTTATRLSWRAGRSRGSTRAVKVVFMSYRNTLQADALKLVAKKMQSSLAVEGELPEDGLAAYGDDGDDMMMALARKIVSGEEEEAETMEEVFAQARNAESEAKELLVADGWKLVEVEPEAVEVNGNGHHDANGIGPTVELVLGNGHAAIPANGNSHKATPVNGNGHHDEATEPQQSLFSWAEFMAQKPVKPKGRSHKPQPATLSMFGVGADSGTGARGRAGRRGTLDQAKIRGRPPSAAASPLAGHVCGPFCVSAPASDRRR